MRLFSLVVALCAVCMLSLSACGGSPGKGLVLSKPGKCAAVSEGDFQGTKAAGATCTQSNQCKPVDCATGNECRVACIDGKCDGADVCNRN